MGVLKVKVVQRFKKGNKIIGYRIQDANGKTMDVEADKFKQVLRSSQAECVNMTLTSDNRLIEHDIHTENTTSKPSPTPMQQKAPVNAPVNAPVQQKMSASAPAEDNPNANIKDEAFIKVSELNEVFVAGEEEDTISFETGTSQNKSVENIINKATMMNRVIKKVNDDVYFIDFGNHKKVVVARAKKLTLIDG